MEIKILSPEEVEFKEKDVQAAFEHDLSKLEAGLVFIDSEVSIPVGRIDTLAFDRNTNKPVFVEFKGPGGFGKDALVQLMDYLSWFTRDENRYAILEKIIRQKKADIEEIEPDVRLICVVAGRIDERIRNAIYALANHAAIYTYLVAKDTAGKVVLIPKLEVDNTEVETGVGVPATEAELLKKHPDLQDLFYGLKAELEKNGAKGYMTGRTYRCKKHRSFANTRLRQHFIRLQLRVGIGSVDDPEFKYEKKGASEWGSVALWPSKGIPDKVKNWIDIAREFMPTQLDEDENEGEGAGEDE
jgi:hypothetical protein